MSDLFPGLQTLIDRTSKANTVYIGTAECGAEGTDEAWCIREVILDTDGRATSIKYANGTSAMDNIWNNRTTLSYS